MIQEMLGTRKRDSRPTVQYYKVVIENTSMKFYESHSKAGRSDGLHDREWHNLRVSERKEITRHLKNRETRTT